MPQDRIDALRQQIDEINQRLLLLISERQDASVAIGAIKVGNIDDGAQSVGPAKEDIAGSWQRIP